MNLSVGYEMGYLFASVPDSNLAELVEESLIFYEHFPVIGEVIEADQDEYGLAKKAIRNEAKRYGRREIPSIPELENSLNPVFQFPDSLGIGRPRMNPFLVFLFLILRGLDDFQEITIDSTPVSGCALFPNDAISMRNCLFRAYCILEIFAREKFIEFQSPVLLKT